MRGLRVALRNDFGLGPGTAGVVTPVVYRSVPDTADSFYVMAPSGRGTGIAHHFIRNSGGSTVGADTGTPWQPWRLVGTKEFASVDDDPLVATPVFIYGDDTGAQNYAFQRSGSTAYMGSYHGGETLTAEALKIGGATFDPTQAVSGSSFSYKYSSTITDGTATVTITDLEITLGSNGTVVNTIGSVSSASSFTRSYIGMMIAYADIWQEAGIRIQGGSGAEIMLPLGYAAPYGATYVGLANEMRLRDFSSGRSVRLATNAPTKTGYRRTSAIRDGSRAKIYCEFQGTLGTLTNLSWTVSFEAGSVGATAFLSNLLTNGAFNTDLSSWNSTSQVAVGGSITQNAFKARLTRGTSGDNRLFQGVATTIGAVYIVRADVVTSAGPQASLGATSAASGSTSTPAPALAPVQWTQNGQNGHVFVATQTTTYAMALQSSGGSGVAGETSDVDNFIMQKLADNI